MKHGVYVPSRGRCRTSQTLDTFVKCGFPFTVVVEPNEAREYKERYGDDHVAVLPLDGQGVAYARNYVKDLSSARGESFHWQLDDNITGFGLRTSGKVVWGAPDIPLNWAEEFCGRYDNIAAAGLSLPTWAFSSSSPFSLNRQVYSCVLIRNDVNARWRPGVVEDTDYSLQVLTLGWCTVLFNTFLIAKAPTMSMSGGNTDSEYAGDGRMLRSRGLQEAWPGEFEVIMKKGIPHVKPSRIWSRFRTELRRVK